jgi:uncharacterized RDD family membrane protein YckC
MKIHPLLVLSIFFSAFTPSLFLICYVSGGWWAVFGGLPLFIISFIMAIITYFGYKIDTVKTVNAMEATLDE